MIQYVYTLGYKAAKLLTILTKVLSKWEKYQVWMLTMWHVMAWHVPVINGGYLHSKIKHDTIPIFNLERKQQRFPITPSVLKDNFANVLGRIMKTAMLTSVATEQNFSLMKAVRQQESKALEPEGLSSLDGAERTCIYSPQSTLGKMHSTVGYMALCCITLQA